MAAKHFKTGEPLVERDGTDDGYRPRHGRADAKPQPVHEGMPTASSSQVQVEGWASDSSTARRGVGDAASTATIRSGRGTGWYYGEPKPAHEGSQAQARPSGSDNGASAALGAGSPSSGSPHRSRILAVCVGGACVVAVVVGLGIWSSRPSGGDASAGSQATTQQVEQTDDGNAAAAAPEASNAALPDTSGASEEEEDASPDALSAADVVSRLSSLSHNGADCSLPADGVEVDARDGWVLVAYQSAEDAQGTLSRMTAAAVALAQDLSDTQLSDSSTAQDGVSAVPATSRPTAISASDTSTAFAGVQVVALGEGRYVIGSLSLTSADGLEGASEAQVLSAAASYAVEGPAYRYSGLASQGVAQSKGNSPTLLTGERIVMRMSVPQPPQSSASGAAGGTGASNTGNRTTSSSTSTSATTSRTSNGGGAARNGSGTGSRSTATGSSASSTRRNTTSSGGGRTGSGSTSGGSTSGSSYGTGGTGGYAGAGGGGYSGSGTGSAASPQQDGQGPQG